MSGAAERRVWACVPDSMGTRSANRKVISQGTHRVAHLADTLARVEAKATAMGVTRIADLTRLDVLGIPSIAAIVPTLNWPPVPGCISVMSGKGVSVEHSRASALMETAERWSARCRPDLPVIRGTAAQLRRRFNLVHPTQFVAPGTNELSDHDDLEWVPARSLVTQTVVLVPAFLVFAPYEPGDADLVRLPWSSNGLASGNTLAEATLHGLYELIERDAEAIALALAHSAPPGGDIPARRVDLDSFADDPDLGPLIARYRAAGITLSVKELTQDIAVPTFFAVTVDPSLRRLEYLNGGKGTHLDPRVALERALTEAAQSRAVIMAGIREDMPGQRTEGSAAAFDALLATYPEWYGDAPDWPTVGLGDLVDRSTDNVLDDLALVVAMLRDSGLGDVLVVDLTHPELDIPVARTLVPGLEFHIRGNWHGPRLSARVGAGRALR